MKFLLLIHFGLDDILYALLNWFVMVGGIVLFFGLIWSVLRSLPKSSPDASQQNEPDVATPQSENYNADVSKEDLSKGSKAYDSYRRTRTSDQI